MIYLIHGSDTFLARAKARQLVESLTTKKPDALFRRYTVENFEQGMLDELIGSQGLFVTRIIIELDTLFANGEYKAVILDTLARLAASENIFIILEEKLLKPELLAFEKHAKKISEYSTADGAFTKKGKTGALPFALADALARRDKKDLWALYTQHIATGAVAEELHGLLFWQIKMMLLAATTPSAEAAGIKSFVYNKARSAGANFSLTELHTLSRKMVSIYHDAHRGLGDLNILLERCILEL